MTEMDTDKLIVNPMLEHDSSSLAHIGSSAMSSEVVAQQLDNLPAHYSEALKRLGGYIERSKADPDTRVLYEEQVPVMENLYDFLLTHTDEPRGRIVLPTGVGKTVLFTEFIKATGLRTLVLTPTTMLLHQTEAAFDKFAGDEEITVGKVYGQQKDEDQQVTLTTYASFVRHTKDEDSPYLGPGKYDLIICDEAHRAMAEGTKAALSRYADTIQIGLTATEDYSARRKLEKVLPHMIHHMTIREAVESELISGFSNWVVETDTDMSKVAITTSNDYDVEQLQKTVNNEVRNQLAVDIYRTYFDGKKAVFFCSGVEHSKAVAQLLRDHGVRAEAIHGGLSDGKQETMKALFADQNPDTGIQVLCNDKILAEGFDEVSVVACFNLAPTLSLVRAQQRSGRTLRLDPSNPHKHAYVVDFVDNNYQKPPVLFADPNVAGSALLGANTDSPLGNLDIAYNLGSATITMDTQAVEAMAQSFHEGRQDKRKPAPEGWLTISGVASEFDLSVIEARRVIAELKEHVPDLLETDSGRFLARGVEGGVTTYYSPQILETVSTAIDDVLGERIQVAPENWLCIGQVATIYDQNEQNVRRDLKAIAASMGTGASGKYKHPQPLHSKSKEFFSPEVIERYTGIRLLEPWTGVPPEGWQTWDDFREQFGVNAINQAQEYVQSSFSGVLSSNSLLHEGELYMGPRIAHFVRQRITPPEDWFMGAGIAEELGIEASVFETVMSDLREAQPKLFNYDEKWFWHDNQEKTFYSKRLRERVIKHYLERFKPTEGTQPEELVDGQEIEIPKAELRSGLAPPPVTKVIDEIEVIPARITTSKTIIRRRPRLQDIAFGDHVSKSKVQVRIKREEDMPLALKSRQQLPEIETLPSKDTPITPTRPVPQAVSRAALLRKYRR